MSYTLGTAAKATGKSKSTIHRAIKSGKISATSHLSGGYLIDPAELHRVFPPVSRNSSEKPIMTQDATAHETVLLQQKLIVLQEERERERAQMQETISDLRRRLDDEASERRKLTALLTYMPTVEQPQEQQKKRGFWRWLLAWN